MHEHEKTDELFRTAVKNLREDKGWTQNQLASELRDAGLSEFRQTTVARLENGDRAIKLGESKIIAAVLGSNTDEMILPVDDENKAKRMYQEANERYTLAKKNLIDSATAFFLAQGNLKYPPGYYGTTEAVQEIYRKIYKEKDKGSSTGVFWDALCIAYANAGSGIDHNSRLTSESIDLGVVRQTGILPVAFLDINPTLAVIQYHEIKNKTENPS